MVILLDHTLEDFLRGIETDGSVESSIHNLSLADVPEIMIAAVTSKLGLYEQLHDEFVEHLGYVTNPKFLGMIGEALWTELSQVFDEDLKDTLDPEIMSDWGFDDTFLVITAAIDYSIGMSSEKTRKRRLVLDRHYGRSGVVYTVTHQGQPSVRAEAEAYMQGVGVRNEFSGEMLEFLNDGSLAVAISDNGESVHIKLNTA